MLLLTTLWRGRTRAIDLERLKPVVRFDDTINADSTIALFEGLERVHLLATWIYVICDNARYYRSKAVQEYLKTSRIKLVFLPQYAPISTSSSDSGNCSRERRSTTATSKLSSNSNRRAKHFLPIPGNITESYARC